MLRQAGELAGLELSKEDVKESLLLTFDLQARLQSPPTLAAGPPVESAAATTPPPPLSATALASTRCSAPPPLPPPLAPPPPLRRACPPQASAARGVGHTEEEGLPEALYKGFVAKLGREGRTKPAATHTANFFGRSGYEMAIPVEGEEAAAAGDEEDKDEL